MAADTAMDALMAALGLDAIREDDTTCEDVHTITRGDDTMREDDEDTHAATSEETHAAMAAGHAWQPDIAVPTAAMEWSPAAQGPWITPWQLSDRDGVWTAMRMEAHVIKVTLLQPSQPGYTHFRFTLGLPAFLGTQVCVHGLPRGATVRILDYYNRSYVPDASLGSAWEPEPCVTEDASVMWTAPPHMELNARSHSMRCFRACGWSPYGITGTFTVDIAATTVATTPLELTVIVWNPRVMKISSRTMPTHEEGDRAGYAVLFG